MVDFVDFPRRDDNDDEKEKRGRGRPPKDEKEKRSEWITFRVREDEKEHIEKRAERAGKSAGTFAREAALGVPMQTAESREKKRETIRQLARIGNNLNQISAAANKGQGINRTELSETLESVRQAIKQI